MKIVLFFMLLSFQIVFAQTNHLGLAINRLSFFTPSGLSEVDDFGDNYSRRRINNLDLGLFFDHAGEKTYYRFQLNMGSDMSSSKYDIVLGDTRDYGKSSRSRVFNRLNAEAGKIWNLTDRIDVRVGGEVFVSGTYPGTIKELTQVYEAGQITTWQEVSTKEGFVFQAGLGPVLRLNYNISKKMQLGLGLPVSFFWQFNDYSTPQTTRNYDAGGALINEVTSTSTNKLVAFGFNNSLRLQFNFGLRLGK